MGVKDTIYANAMASSGVQQRTLDANITGKVRNGPYKSNMGFISQEQVNAKSDFIKEYNKQAKGYNKDKNQAIDTTQSALANVGGSVSRGQGLNGNTGYLSLQRPYLVMSIPNISLPDNYGHYYGYPCNMTCNLGDLSGFTVVSDCHLDGFRCTKTELDEIEALLKEGVIL